MRTKDRLEVLEFQAEKLDARIDLICDEVNALKKLLGVREHTVYLHDDHPDNFTAMLRGTTSIYETGITYMVSDRLNALCDALELQMEQVPAEEAKTVFWRKK